MSLADYAWAVIKATASEMIQEPEDGGIRRHARLSKRFSFTRSVSRDLFQRSQSKTSLYDGVSPVIVIDENEQESKEDVFTFTPIKNQLLEECKAV
jgi:tyrosine decarboxylase